MEGARVLQDFLLFWKKEASTLFIARGGGAVRETDFRHGGGHSHLPPMRKERVGEMTHPCPAGQGYAAGVRDRRCLPLRGKSASELARLILGVSRGRVERGALCPSGTVGRRAGRTESAQRFMQTAFLNRRRRQAPARGLVAVCTHSSPKRNESQSVCPLLVGQTGVNPEPTALEAGTAGTAGSARTRSRDQSLENPFLGNRHSKKRRRRTAPARGPSAVYLHYRPNRNETKRPSPLLVGLERVDLEPKALADRTAVTRESWSQRRNQPCGRLRG